MLINENAHTMRKKKRELVLRSHLDSLFL